MDGSVVTSNPKEDNREPQAGGRSLVAAKGFTVKRSDERGWNG